MRAFFVTGPLTAPAAPEAMAACERVRVFAALGLPAQIVSLGYSPHWFSTIQAAGLQPAQVVAVFDQLQQIPERPIRPLPVAALRLPASWVRSQRGEAFDYHRGDSLVARIQASAEQQIEAVTFYTERGERERREVYDERGFCGQVEHFAGDQLVSVDYLTVSGQVAVHQDFRQRGLLTVAATGARYASFLAFAAGMLAPLVQPGDLVIAEGRECDRVVAHLPAGVVRGYRLRRQSLTVTPGPADLVLTSHYAPALPTALVFDEDDPAAQLQRGWQRILAQRGWLPDA